MISSIHKFYVRLINKNKAITSSFVVNFLYYPDFYVIKYDTKIGLPNAYHDYLTFYVIIYNIKLNKKTDSYL
jgi:hypothetical protein